MKATLDGGTHISACRGANPRPYPPPRISACCDTLPSCAGSPGFPLSCPPPEGAPFRSALRFGHSGDETWQRWNGCGSPDREGRDSGSFQIPVTSRTAGRTPQQHETSRADRRASTPRSPVRRDLSLRFPVTARSVDRRTRMTAEFEIITGGERRRTPGARHDRDREPVHRLCGKHHLFARQICSVSNHYFAASYVCQNQHPFRTHPKPAQILRYETFRSGVR